MKRPNRIFQSGTKTPAFKTDVLIKAFFGGPTETRTRNPPMRRVRYTGLPIGPGGPIGGRTRNLHTASVVL